MGFTDKTLTVAGGLSVLLGAVALFAAPIVVQADQQSQQFEQQGYCFSASLAESWNECL